MLHVGDWDEQLLHDRAQRTRASFQGEAQAIIESGCSPEQQNEAAKQLLSKLTNEENAVLEQSYSLQATAWNA